jgi:hypothetical protein
MARQAREVSGTGIYHVMMRGINRQNIFEDEEDYVTACLSLCYLERGERNVSLVTTSSAKNWKQQVSKFH